MAGKSSTVTVQILADNSQYKREMGETAQVTDKTSKQMGGSTESAGKQMSTFAKVAVAAIAVKALGAVKEFVGSSLTAFSDLNESLNALEVQYGENADGIKKLGEGAAQSLGLSNAEFNGYAVSVSAFAQQIAGESGDVVGTVETLSTRVADFASVMNIEVGEAFTKFRSGLAGESEPLRVFGIDVSAARVEAQALTDGIWDGVGAMSEDQKVRARFNTIMEQTSKVHGDFANTSDDAANKQRILNAEMENQKALLGRSLLPLQQKWLEIQTNAIPVIGQLAIELGVMTGALSNAEAALIKFETEEGRAVETAKDLIDAIRDGQGLTGWAMVLGSHFQDSKATEFTNQLKEAIGTIDLTTEEIKTLTVMLNTMREAGEITEDQFKELTTAIENNQAAKARDDYRNLMRGLQETDTATVNLTDSQEELNVEIKTGIDLTREAHDANKAATDALFGVKEATRKQAAAQEAVNEAVKEHGEGSAEHIEALEDLAGANADLRSAQIKLNEEGALTREEFINQQISMGLLREDAERLADAYDDLFTPRSVTHTIKFRQPTKDNPFNIPRAQHGGRIHGPTLVGEAGPEVFVPDSAGTVIPNHRLNGSNGSSMGGTVINLSVNALDPQSAARAVVEALQSYMRSNGALPITVRSA